MNQSQRLPPRHARKWDKGHSWFGRKQCEDRRPITERKERVYSLIPAVCLSTQKSRRQRYPWMKSAWYPCPTRLGSGAKNRSLISDQSRFCREDSLITSGVPRRGQNKLISALSWNCIIVLRHQGNKKHLKYPGNVFILYIYQCLSNGVSKPLTGEGWKSKFIL